jgi:hypothetical protein
MRKHLAFLRESAIENRLKPVNVYMKKQTILLIVISFLWIMLPVVADAQTGDSTPEPTVAPDSETIDPATQFPTGVIEIPFALADQRTFELRSPADAETFNFTVPQNWQVNPANSYLEIRYDTVVQSVNPAQLPVVQVSVDGEIAGTFLPETGTNNVVRIDLPATAFVQPDDFQKEVRFLLYAGRNCADLDHIRVNVHEDSIVHLDYTPQPLAPDLADFPYPLEQGFYTPETIYLVIPDDYSDTDLTAVAAVATALGNSVQRETTTVVVVNASNLTPETLANSSAVIIGTPSSNRFLADLYNTDRLPTRLSAEGNILPKSGGAIGSDDGVLQLIVAENNPDFAYLVVTGGSNAGILKAASALSAENGRFGFEGDLVIVEQVATASDAPQDVPVRRTLGDLGFRDTTLSGLGSNRASLSFFVPSNWRVQADASLELSLVHAGGLTPYASGVTIELNDRAIGSVAIEPNNATNQLIEIPISPSDILAGENNRLTFRATLDVADDCAPLDTDLAWLRVRNSSVLNLPYLTGAMGQKDLSLSNPFNTFATQPNLSDVWVVMSANPTPAELTGLAQIAWQIGRAVDGAGFAPRVTRDITNMADLAGNHAIAIGRPSANALTQAVNGELLQPFVAAGDDLQQGVGEVAYRLPASFGVGVIQLQSAPWDGAQSLLVVAGTSDTGVTSALNAFAVPEIADQLGGDLAFVHGDRVETLDSAGLVVGAVPLAVGGVLTGTNGLDPNGFAGTTNGEIPANYLPQVDGRPLAMTIAAIAFLVLSGVLVGGGIWWQRRDAGLLISE